eukprot:624993-Prymnesium_polylepis.1
MHVIPIASCTAVCVCVCVRCVGGGERVGSARVFGVGRNGCVCALRCGKYGFTEKSSRQPGENSHTNFTIVDTVRRDLAKTKSTSRRDDFSLYATRRTCHFRSRIHTVTHGVNGSSTTAPVGPGPARR